MVGGRAEDISAARAHDVRGVAAGWGMGPARNSRQTRRITWLRQLLIWVLRAI